MSTALGRLGLLFIYLELLLVFFDGALSVGARPADDALTNSALSFPIRRRVGQNKSLEQWGEWARRRKTALETKYGGTRHGRRANGLNLVSNQNADSSYFGSIAVGTPPISFNVILDTGSADLWLASADVASSMTDNIPTFNPSGSTTYEPLNESWDITYGSGAAEGVLGRDTIQFAGFEVKNQTLGVVHNITENLLSAPVSGVLGLAWQSISTANAKPLWLTLAETPGTLDEPLMAFHLTRYSNDSSVRSVEPGGSFTLGSVNRSLYAGEIDYQDVPNNAVGYWLLSMKSMTVAGKELDLSSGSLAAIDTGTTLVGGPADIIAALYENIPGAAPGTDSWQGYYTIPCDTEVTITLTFGTSNISWPIAPSDFHLMQLADKTCIGAFFELRGAMSGSGPSWIIGDTFLKNVYSVFRADPPSVGFAALSQAATLLNGADHAVPTPTVGSPAAVVTSTENAAPRLSSAPSILLVGSAILLMTLL